MAKVKAKKAKSGDFTTQARINRLAAEIAEVSQRVVGLQTDHSRLAIRVSDLNRYHETLGKKVQAVEGASEVQSATLTQVSDLFVTLRKVLGNASAELAGAASYTQQEISRMSADEYREKVLVPLNMGRRV